MSKKLSMHSQSNGPTVGGKTRSELNAQNAKASLSDPSSSRSDGRTRLLVDGVFFQLTQSGIGRVWTSIMPALVEDPAVDLIVLDRGGLPDISGLRRIPFPTYTMEHYNADDSALIQQVCDYYNVDVFTSTYYTTPLTTPMFLLIYDMIPELLGFDLGQRGWKEKAIAISYARRHISISQSTHEDLLRFYPDLCHATFVHLAHDREIFKPRDGKEVSDFRRSLGFDRRPYVVTVGEREQAGGYKNGRLLFEAIAASRRDDVDILCIGGEPTLGKNLTENLPARVRVKRIAATDEELALAYSGAMALIYPSLYEGFGLPVLEAMACGCPVVTTENGSLKEVAGDAALFIDGKSPLELSTALSVLRSPAERSRLRESGLKQAQKFDWSAMTSAVQGAVSALAKTALDPDYKRFAETWRTLRRMQSEVDVDRL